ncbi:MAG TPA: signal peptidase I [Planctomycetota bacterium]|nr:signal peptidase I [Planctomycetota bacterium]
MAAAADDANKEKKPEQSFWDSMWGLGFLICSILLGRFYVLEPFKIPSGSMEPTLIGHEDYGDRIVTNKLAYVDPKTVGIVLAVAAVLIIIGFFASKAHQRTKSIIKWALLTIAVIGGIGFSWINGAVAGEPKRFEVVVFYYNEDWEIVTRDDEGAVRQKRASKKINYIKRLVGLPGETIVVSGGDLFRREAGADQIIRKNDENADIQDVLWYPINEAWKKQRHELPAKNDPNAEAIQAQLEDLAFPWEVTGNTGGKALDHGLQIDAADAVKLTYKYPITNIYVKQGRWPFRHLDCPAAKSPEGSKVRMPDQKTEHMTAYIEHSCNGVQCSNCRQVLFPLGGPRLDGKPQIMPELFNTFKGGNMIMNDLKLEMEIDVQTAGAMQIQLGSALHSALWTLGGADSFPAVEGTGSTVHPVSKLVPVLSPGRHTLSLAYVDGTVTAMLDGQQVEKTFVEVKPAGTAAFKNSSIITVSFKGLKGTLKQLNIFRDLYYLSDTTQIQMSSRQNTMQPSLRNFEDEGTTLVTRLPQDNYLMFGDNSPSSKDSRTWGTVPKEELIGRASFVWWPPSRWRFIK